MRGWLPQGLQFAFYDYRQDSRMEGQIKIQTWGIQHREDTESYGMSDIG